MFTESGRKVGTRQRGKYQLTRKRDRWKREWPLAGRAISSKTVGDYRPRTFWLGSRRTLGIQDGRDQQYFRGQTDKTVSDKKNSGIAELAPTTFCFSMLSSGLVENQVSRPCWDTAPQDISNQRNATYKSGIVPENLLTMGEIVVYKRIECQGFMKMCIATCLTATSCYL